MFSVLFGLIINLQKGALASSLSLMLLAFYNGCFEGLECLLTCSPRASIAAMLGCYFIKPVVEDHPFGGLLLFFLPG